MHKNRLWLLFLFAIISTTLWYSFATAQQIWHTISLSEPHRAQVKKWEVYEGEDELFYPKVSYTFSKEGQAINATEVLDEEIFKNPWRVEERIEELENEKWTVWCYPKEPSQCSLQPQFPVKRAVYTLILLSICFYFVFLGKYVGRRANRRK